MAKNDDFIPFTGMWKKTSKNGTDYLSAMFTKEKHGDMLKKLIADLEQGPVNLMAFRTKEKKSDKSPDWNLSYAVMKPLEQAQPSSPPPSQGTPDDDIPF